MKSDSNSQDDKPEAKVITLDAFRKK
jgi:hypothetical protein